MKTYWAINGICVSELAQPAISSELQWWLSELPCLDGKSSRACRIRAVCWFFSSSASSCSVLLLRLPIAVPVEPVEVEVFEPKMFENRTCSKVLDIKCFAQNNTKILLTRTMLTRNTAKTRKERVKRATSRDGNPMSLPPPPASRKNLFLDDLFSPTFNSVSFVAVINVNNFLFMQLTYNLNIYYFSYQCGAKFCFWAAANKWLFPAWCLAPFYPPRWSFEAADAWIEAQTSIRGRWSHLQSCSGPSPHCWMGWGWSRVVPI